MSLVLKQALTDLDRYQSEWSLASESPVTTTAPGELLTWLERRMTLWDDKLNAAAELAASVEKQIEDRESAMERWHEVFVRWRELIQNKVDSSGTSPG
jgi:hypothetical protein